MNAHELKALQTRLAKAEAEIPELKDAVAIAQRELSQKQNLATQLKAEIAKATEESAAFIVTEHAMLRFFERVLGFDLEKLREMILPPDIAEAIASLGNGVYPVSHGGKEFRIAVKGRQITTIEVGAHSSQRKKARGPKPIKEEEGSYEQEQAMST